MQPTSSIDLLHTIDDDIGYLGTLSLTQVADPHPKHTHFLFGLYPLQSLFR